MTKRNTTIALALAALALTTGCQSIDDNRIPAVQVSVVFSTVGEWNTYGVGGALEYRRFIRSENIPANFPYTATTYTGFGGILLVGDIYGEPKAYDLSCPVECKKDVRIAVDRDNNIAECPVCHSTYDVFSNDGYPLSGLAAQRGYGLQRYHVTRGASNYYMILR